MRPTALSLFSGGGVGDVALTASGVDLVVASEIAPRRAALHLHNHPHTHMVVGDIEETKGQVIEETRRRLGGRPLDLILASPPCQGMSKNGRGKLLQGVRSGSKDRFDPRNRLSFAVTAIARELMPRVIIFENVPEMEDMAVVTPGGVETVLSQAILSELSPEYTGAAEVVDFADYGIPQRRQRLITVLSRDARIHALVTAGRSLLPPRTHSSSGEPLPWVSVDTALSGIPPLDAGGRETARHPGIPLHRVPLLDAKKHLWVRYTGPGETALNNQCINPDCLFQGNPRRTSGRDPSGIRRAGRDGVTHCLHCGHLLPRPVVGEGESMRPMVAFSSAYKRMKGSMPAPTLTKNFSYACSDQKLHPRENRTLSLHEASILQTISEYPYSWDGASDGVIRDVIGESIPPRGLEIILRHLLPLAGIPLPSP